MMNSICLFEKELTKLKPAQQNLLKKYNGSQLRPLFTYEHFHLVGDSIIAFIAPCDVTLDHMVDYEDKIENASIKSDLMLHFIIEKFPAHLESGVMMQRLLASIVADEIRLLSDEKIIRKGDDLYLDLDHKYLSLESLQNCLSHDDVIQKLNKLTISIASISTVSTMVHFAINVKSTGAPVKVASLEDLGIDVEKFASKVLFQFCKEMNSIYFATVKVKPLG